MRKRETKIQLGKQKGITLIALVVTIIVLIILAGVSINLVLGDNGIITKAKEAKENTEIAKVEEEIQLNEAVEYLENVDVTKTVEEMKEAKTYMLSKTTLKDSNGNKVVVPEGFKIAEDSGINVTEGIVIEDNDIKEGIGNDRGNQYVWIPVGKNIKKQNEKDGTITEVDIVLGRYIFADGTNHKDNEGKVLEKGIPILKQSAENYEDETPINIKEISPLIDRNHDFKEMKLNRDGIASEDRDGLNATALDLKGFIDSIKVNGGYYIARYEASYGVDEKANSKVSTGTPATSNDTVKIEGMLWNYITQLEATVVSRNLYEKVNTDLINSYAWDTAIVYIQSFSGDTDYSYQNSKNTSFANTGVNGDEVCKINDMASNILELTTEYANEISENNYAYCCTNRGGYYSNSDVYPSFRNLATATINNHGYTFRTILYM